MSLFKVVRKKDRFEIYIFGTRITFYRYLRILREIYLLVHYNQLNETLNTKFNINLPKDAYHRLYGKVELVEIPLKDLRIPVGRKKTCLITDTAVYKYLESNGKTNYNYRLPDYFYEADVYLPIDKNDTETRMAALVESIERHDYDPSKCAITARKNNIIIDGQHRAAVLYHKYGGDHKVLVVREK